MQTLNLSPNMLTWAADQIGKSLESLVEGLAKREKDRALLLEGKLTTAQLEKFAKLTGVPFGLLFLDAPPTLQPPTIPDLRQTLHHAPLSRDFHEVHEDAVRKQAWYVEYLIETGSQPLPFVGKFNASTRPDTVVNDIAQSLGLSEHLRKSVTTPEAYFSLLAERAEDLGILVMKTGIVKSNTRRPLSVAEFRGFAVIDKLAPLVFINGRDAEVAAVFTLMHELAHVWTGQSGVSDLGFGQTGNKGIEWLCNQVAAELLVPKDEFLPVWNKDSDVSTLAKQFRVSRVVIARRALDFGLMDAQAYAAVVAQSRAKSNNNERGGGNPYATIPVRNSKRLTTTIVRSALSGDVLLRDAASLLHVKPDTVMELGRRGKSFD